MKTYRVLYGTVSGQYMDVKADSAQEAAQIVKRYGYNVYSVNMIG